ncbi:CARDB domain-containing protein [Thiocystis violacea]|uniref:CARDB domain-containing protein n=1 Tax=Thiocystis violacea TaxID=13725 RepID=UPI00190715EF|nr:CARDB domain-containing protein [Thiocystis violacea]MBK1722620.1 hypothetical protein [Thiocystis violacea]
MKSAWSFFAAASLSSVVTTSHAYVIGNWWPDGDNIVMDDVLLPAATWSTPAQSQMSEWNYVDTTNNSHPFRINNNPQFSFGANDGDNTIGFLSESGLNSEYGLSYASALAWTIRWSGFFSGRIDECDIALDPTLGWSLNPNDSTWFQSTVLHELGHCRGLSHENDLLSIENSGTSKYLRAETLYMDDRVGIRQHASAVTERDIVIYNKWHDGSLPRWMTMSPTTLREGDIVTFNNITAENRGNQSFTGPLRFGVYLSTNATISTGDQLLNTGSWGSFGTYTLSTFNWSAQIPTMSDCATRYIGAVIDDNGAWAERYEGNNAVTFTNGVAYTGSSYTPTPLTILLAEDVNEPNDSTAAATAVTLPYVRSNLSIDQDAEEDFYRMVAPRRGTFNLSATFSHALGDINLRLLNSSGGTLASSTTTTNNESITYHVNTGGTYYARVYGWGGGSCNKYSLSLSFTPDWPDLIVARLNLSDIILSLGQTFAIDATVLNQGEGASDATTLRYYLSADEILSKDDRLLGTDAVGALEPGARSPQDIRATAPDVPGDYWIGACVDAVKEESDTTNQCYAMVKIGVGGRPDLTVEDLALSSAKVSAGGAFEIKASVHNLGSVGSTASTLRYFLSADQTIDRLDKELGNNPVPGLRAGDSATDSIRVSAPSTAGTWWIGACVDPVTGETATGNQCFSPGAELNVSVGTPDDLLITDETWAGTENRRACNSITAGPRFVVKSGSNVSFQAGAQILLKSDVAPGAGVTIEKGASFTAVIGTPPGC